MISIDLHHVLLLLVGPVILETAKIVLLIVTNAHAVNSGGCLRFAQHRSGIHPRSSSGVGAPQSFHPRRFIGWMSRRRERLRRILLRTQHPSFMSR